MQGSGNLFCFPADVIFSEIAPSRWQGSPPRRFHLMSSHRYCLGDWVVYRKTKHSASPGPRAKEISPEPNGEAYSYCVEKFWTVTNVENGHVVLMTRRGKQHTVEADDPNLRHARWWEKLLYRDRFPQNPPVTVMRSAG
jgi:hypothetical protein